MDVSALLKFREIEPTDLEGAADLLVEMQGHYRAHCPVRAEIIAGLGSRPTGTRILLALERDTIVGLACFSAVYPGPGLTSGYFLKELYVRTDQRGSGIGKMLMSRLAILAQSEGISRIDWTADIKDKRLQQFYEALGGRALPEKLFFRISGSELTALADS